MNRAFVSPILGGFLKAKADAQGKFKIASLDPSLIFTILVVAKDCNPKYVARVDPAAGPVKVKLEPRHYADAPMGNRVIGRVLGNHGQPIEGAAVKFHGIHRKDGSWNYGMVEGVDPLAVTDDLGEFLLTSRTAFASMEVKVDARGFAQKIFTDLTSGTSLHVLKMTEGAAVSGRVIWNGKPLPGVSMGLVSVELSRNDAVGLGSAVVSTAVFGVSPKTLAAAASSPIGVGGIIVRLAGETPARTTETVALPLFNCIFPAKRGIFYRTLRNRNRR